MQDRLRKAHQAAAELAERAQRLGPGRSSDDDTTHDDDEHDEEIDEELRALDVSDPAHEELARLDEEDAEPMALDADRSLFDDLREIDPTPPLPLADVHEAGFASLIPRMDKVEGTGLTDQAVVRRILDLVGDRLPCGSDPTASRSGGSSAGAAQPGTTWSTSFAGR